MHSTGYRFRRRTGPKGPRFESWFLGHGYALMGSPILEQTGCQVLASFQWLCDLDWFVITIKHYYYFTKRFINLSIKVNDLGLLLETS